MSSELLAAIVGALIAGILGFLGGVVANYYGFRLQKTRNFIEWSYIALPLFQRHELAEGRIRLAVSRAALGGLPGQSPTDARPTEVNSATVFEIRLENIGRDKVNKPRVEITLEEPAKIVSRNVAGVEYTIDDAEADRIDVDLLRRNVLYGTLPYLNSKQVVTVSLMAVGTSMRECSVRVFGPDVYSRPKARDTSWLRTWLIVLLILAPIAAGVLVGITRFLGGGAVVATAAYLGLVVGSFTTIIAIIATAITHRFRLPR